MSTRWISRPLEGRVLRLDAFSTRHGFFATRATTLPAQHVPRAVGGRDREPAAQRAQATRGTLQSRGPGVLDDVERGVLVAHEIARQAGEERSVLQERAGIEGAGFDGHRGCLLHARGTGRERRSPGFPEILGSGAGPGATLPDPYRPRSRGSSSSNTISQSG
jgi:hypothetical protein